MSKVVIGILAHVDAGKTTLSEAMLYLSGAIRKLGRVDHKDAYLDNYIQERERGITIFSKLAEFSYEDLDITLVDTPGHVDFAAEMERTLQILDYAILVVNGREGVQGHTHTLAKLLKKYDIPTFIFVNKMDIEGSSKEEILKQLKHYIGDNCIDFTEQALEELAYCDENLMEQYIENGSINEEDIKECIKNRSVIPCYFGSALKLINIKEFMDDLAKYTLEKEYPGKFGARVYKISRDRQNNRLTYMKITGGSLKVKTPLTFGYGEESKEEKIDQIRRYSGAKFELMDEVKAGSICAVTGLSETYPGQPLGAEIDDVIPILEPVLTYRVIPPEKVNIFDFYSKLKLIEEEVPELNILWDEEVKEIKIQLMGQVQLEVISEMVRERFDLDIAFDRGEIAYKETIEGSAVGIGHFEPLRHYAEAQLLLEEGERGSGIVIDTKCSEDDLDRNWQRLIITHLEEKIHTGPLTNSPITDMKISVVAGRAHQKHTEGGDFRQATYRALRNGLMNAKSILLEPYYAFNLEVPQDCIGRAMSDLTLMNAYFDQPKIVGENAVLKGRAPVSTMANYGVQVASYTGGLGILTLMVDGYDKCHNTDEVVSQIAYDCCSDISNTGDSVFCANGAGFIVPWNKVKEYAHTEYNPGKPKDDNVLYVGKAPRVSVSEETEEELQAIFEKTYGKAKDRTYIHQQVIRPTMERVEIAKTEIKEEYLLVDGYNIIFAWDELKALAKDNMDSAREALIEILNNYQGFKNIHVIVVFDAYKVKGATRKLEKFGNVDVVYTKEAETADSYIEQFTYEKASKYYVRVATSDSLEQLIILGHGAFKVSADQFYLEVKETEAHIAEVIAKYNRQSAISSKVTIGDKMKNKER